MSALRRVHFLDRASWLRARRQGIGASEVSAILGLNPNRSIWEVWLSKVKETGPEPLELYDADLEAARWGMLLEGPVRAEVARRIGRRIFVPSQAPGAPLVDGATGQQPAYVSWYNDDLPVPLFVTPDGQIDSAYVPESWAGPMAEQQACSRKHTIMVPCLACGGRGVHETAIRREQCGTCEGVAKLPYSSPCLRPAGHPFDGVPRGGHVFELIDPRGPGLYEGKTAGVFVSREEWADEGPALHIIQLQAGLAVLGWNWGVLAGLIGGQRLVMIEHEREAEWIAWMVDELAKFWQLVKTKTPPAPDASESTRRALAEFYARGVKGATVELPAIARAWASQRSQGKALIKKGDGLVLEAENRIKDALGNATTGLFPTRADEKPSGFRWPVIQPKVPTCPHCDAAIREGGSHRRLQAFGGTKVEVEQENDEAAA